MSESKPTKGAVKAVQELMSISLIDDTCGTTGEHVDDTARMIDEATGAPELLETLREIAKCEAPYSRDQLTFANNVIAQSVELAEAAIAKYGGEE